MSKIFLWAFMGIYGHLWTFSLIIHSLPFTVINYTQKILILPKIYCFFNLKKNNLKTNIIILYGL